MPEVFLCLHDEQVIFFRPAQNHRKQQTVSGSQSSLVVKNKQACSGNPQWDSRETETDWSRACVQICRRERLKCGHVSQDNKTETQILFAFILTFYLFINTKFAPTYLVFKVSQWRCSRLHYEIYCNYTSIIQSTRLNSFLHGKVSEQLHYFFLKNRQFT